MSKVAVVVDSVASLPTELVGKYDMHIIPVRVAVDGRVYHDTDEDLPAELIHRFQKLPQIDTTPWPPEFYFQEYKKLSREADNIVHVVCFSQFTATISLAKAGAMMAQEAIPHLKVEVLDSTTVAMAQGFIALAAARAAAEGKDISQVVEVADAVKSRVDSIFSFDTLGYLARTRRINKLASWASSLLNVKPVIRLCQGKLYPVALTRSKQKATEKIINRLGKHVDGGEALHVAVMEVGRPAEAEDLAAIIKERVRPVELYIISFTPVMQAVAGPSGLGIAFYGGEQNSDASI